MKEQKSNTFFGGAAILAISIAIVMVIGALYKIPLGRILGDVGFGHFNNAYAIYNLLLMVSTAGLPVAMSKTISEANALGRRNQVGRVFRVSLITFIILGAISSLIMFVFAQQLADLQGDSLAAPAVRVMALSCFFVCTMSAYRGYAQGHSDMVPTAFSQVLEALTKLIVGLVLAWYILYLGFGSEFSAAGAIGGVTASGFVSLVYLMIRHHRRSRRRDREGSEDTPDSAGRILKTLLAIAIPITLSSSVVPITTYLDTVQVQNLLQSALGYSEELAVSLYGCYQKAVTIYNLPAAFMVSLTACIVPAVSAALTKKDTLGAGKIAESALRVGALLALPAGVGLAVLSAPIIQMLYPETNQEVASHCLFLLGIASIFVCMMLLCNAILQANGMVNLPILAVVIGGVVKVIVNFILVGNPNIRINGAPVGTLTCFIVISALEIFIIRRSIPAPPSFLRAFLKPFVPSALMAAAAWATYGLLTNFLHFGNSLATIGGIGVGVVVYLVLVLALRVLSREDLALMPKGDKIAKILHIK